MILDLKKKEKLIGYELWWGYNCDWVYRSMARERNFPMICITRSEQLRQEDWGNLEMGHRLKVPYLSATLSPTWVPVVLEATGPLTFIPSPTRHPLSWSNQFKLFYNLSSVFEVYMFAFLFFSFISMIIKIMFSILFFI